MFALPPTIEPLILSQNYQHSRNATQWIIVNIWNSHQRQQCLSVNRKHYCEWAESGTVTGGQDGYYHCPVSLYCHPENRVKCLWTKLNSVVTFFPRINQLIKMDTAHWKDLSVLIFLKFLSGWEKCSLVKVRGFPLKSGSCWCTKLSLNSSPLTCLEWLQVLTAEPRIFRSL